MLYIQWTNEYECTRNEQTNVLHSQCAHILVIEIFSNFSEEQSVFTLSNICRLRQCVECTNECIFF